MLWIPMSSPQITKMLGFLPVPAEGSAACTAEKPHRIAHQTMIPAMI